MLYLDNPIGPIHGVMLYSDHADPNLFYYLPERPRLARNEDGPEFIFLKYKRDITDNVDFTPAEKQALGGAFLAFTTDLGIDDDVADQIKAKVGGNATGEVRLTPVPCRSGSVRLSIARDTAGAPGAPAAAPTGLKFFEEVYGTSTPSLYGSNRATFALALGQEAATLFEAALKSGICPIGVIYDLEFLGLRPAFDVKVTANYSRIYDSLDIQFGVQASYASIGLKAEIDLAWQKLRENGSIVVEVKNFSDDENLRKQSNAAFEFFKTMLVKDFFTPALAPPSYMQTNTGAGQAAPLSSMAPSLASTQQGAAQPVTAMPVKALPAAGARTVAEPPRSLGSNVARTAQTNSPVAAPPPRVAPPVSNLPARVPPPQVAAAVAPVAPAAPAPGAPGPAAPAPVPVGPVPVGPAPAAPAPANPAPPAPNPAAPAPVAGQPPAQPNLGTTLLNRLTGTDRPPVAATPQKGALPPGLINPGQQAKGVGFGLQLSFTLKKVHTDELKTRTFEFSEQDAVAQEVAPQGMFSTMIHGLDLSRYMKEISLDDDFFKRINTTVSIGNNLAIAGVDTVAVNFEYPARRDGKPALSSDGTLFKPTATAPFVFTCWLDDAKSLDFEYQMTVEFSAQSEWVGKSTKMVSPWITSRAHSLAIDPLDMMGLFDLPISVETLDSSIQHVSLELAYDDVPNDFSDHRIVVLKAGDPIGHWKLRLSDPALRDYRYRATYVFTGNTQYTTDWVDTDSATLVVKNPFQNQLSLRVVPILEAANLQEADVEIVYIEADTGYEARVPLVFEQGSLATKPLLIPTIAKQPAGYTATTTIIHLDGSVASPPTQQKTFQDTAIAITEGAGASHRIAVSLPDPNLAAAGLLALRVVVWTAGDNPDVAEAVFTPSATAEQSVLLLQTDGGPWIYHYAITGYSALGVPRIGETGTSTAVKFLVRLSA